MKASLLAVAVLATIAISSAIDEECIQRKLRGLPVHWPNPANCNSFYRCTNKNVKRELLCPAGREYNTKTGRCAAIGRNLCKLSLRAALDEPTSPCANEFSGTYVADIKSCRGFNICNNNLAYPQSCEAGSYFNTTAAVCVPDTNATCWENLCLAKESGVCLVNDNDCYSFYICSNQTTVAQDCPGGSYFDKGTLNCRPGVCPSDITTEPCTEETTTPTSKEEDCPEDFTTTTEACTTAVNTAATTEACTNEITTTTESCSEETTTPVVEVTTCREETTTTEPSTTEIITTATTEACTDENVTTQSKCDQTKCKGAVDLTSFPSLDTNAGYCVCIKEQPEYRECADNAIYDVALNVCIVQTGTTMPVTCAGGYEQGEFVPNVDNCMLFYICFDGQLLEATCGTGNYYDDQNKNCMLDTEGKCINSQPIKLRTKRSISKPISDTTTCIGGIQEGEITSNPANCSSYYICRNNELKEEFCRDSYYFNYESNKCEEDINHICWPPCMEGDISANDNTCSSYYVCCNYELKEKFCNTGYYFNSQSKTCEEDINHLCWPRCKEGGISTNANTCSSYYVCCNNELKEEFCNVGYYFNSQTNKCEEDINHTCWPRCKEGEISANANTCSSYYVCCNNELKEEFCNVGYYFNSQTNKCEEDIDHICWPRCNEGEISVNNNTCSSYYVCCNNELKEKFCNVGYYFNSQTNKCEEDIDHICWTRCNEGEISANNNTCSSYYVCCNDELKEEFCNEGYYFNSQTEKCEEDINHTCWPRCKEGDISANANTCSSYYVCCNNELKEEFCNVGYYFNSQNNKCEEDINQTCGPRCKEGDISANNNTCSSYYVCSNNELKEKFCNVGYYFNSQTNKCEEDIDHICWPRCKEGDISPNANTCSSYYMCCNNELKEEFCNEGYYFNSQTEKCEEDINHICWPRCNEGEISANNNTCSSYYVCCNNELKEKFCNVGYYFNTQTNKCEDDINHICWPRCNEGEISANNNTCSSYYVCSNNELKEEFCNEGYYFNSQTEKCEEDINHTCWPRCKEGDISANNNTCSSYYVCCNDELKEEFCNEGYYFNSQTEKCEEDINHICWPRCNEGEISANNNTCSSYYVCCNNELKEKFCNVGYYFNSQTNKCEDDINHICWPRCNEGKISANNNTCSSYYVCSNNELKEEFCNEGYYFNSQTEKCEEDINHTCWPRCKEGDISANNNTCSSYYVCCNDELKEEFCNEGYYFNSQTEKCEEDINHICWPRCNEGEISANNNTCSSYYVCCNNELKEKFCNVGYYFNTQTNKCEDDINHICWPRCNEGEISANNNTCSSYYVCSNNELKEEFCNEGYYFNSQTEKCEDDINHICWPRCNEGEISANNNTCSSYYVCSNNELKEEFCNEGYYFNSQTEKCEEDINHICWPRCNEGEISGNNNTCSSYYVCCNDELKEEFCNEGYYFNSQTEKCEEDINHTCWPRCKEGEISANANTCSSYYVCCNNELKENFCNVGYYFNSQTNKCEEDTNNICWPRCKEGEISPNANTCSSYYVCFNNELKEEFCNEGYYFNSQTEKCEEDVNHICWQRCNEGEISANNNTCSSYYVCCNNELKEEFCNEGHYFNSQTEKCEEDINHTCWPRCKEGEILPNANTCSSYYVCCNNELQEEFCNVGYYFNSQTNKCEEDVNHICWQRCNEGEISANNNTCSSYYVCCNNELKEEFCNEGHYFNSQTEKCEEDIKHTCWPRCKEGEILPNANTCSSYYVCCNNELKEEFCNIDYYFNSKTNKCEEDTNNICWPRCKEGDISANANTCSSYYVCFNNELKEEFCHEGYYFNSLTEKCEEDVNHICWQRCNEGEISANNNTCSSYYVCCNKELKEEFCNEGYYFNSQTEKCEEDINHTCWPRCKEGEISANANTCSSYYVCCNNELKEKFCNVGYYFNTQTNKCEDDINHICWPRCNEGEISANNNTCSSYYVCSNNELKEEFCNEGYYFNSQTEKCEDDINHICWPRCNEGEISANNNTCSSYYVCSNNELKEEFCNEGYYFNSQTEKCEEDINHICWPRCNEGEISGNNNTCSSYYVCCNDELKEEFCNEGYYFNSQTEKCEEDINHTCWPRCKEGEISANANTCSSYYVCCNNELKENFCNVGYYFNSQTNKCEEDTNNICWPRCKEGEISPNANTCSSYYVCFNNELKEEFCNEGYYFNSQTEKCEEDVNHICWQRCNEGEISANNNTCSSYYVCCNNELKEEFCNEGHYFNSQTEKCEEDINHTCWPRCKEGEILPNANTCSSYYVCCNNELQEEFCNVGYYFNSQTNKCEEDVNHICWQRCNEGEISANNNTCSSYYVCCNNELKEEFCNEGHYFNSQTEKCEEDINHTCWPRCKEGEILPNANTCSSYYVCCNNELKEEFCNIDYYFNSKTNKCEEDTNNICWPRCKEGDISANANTCSSYYVCFNNELKEEFCHESYYFNSLTEKCEEDVNHICWQRCNEGEISANNNTCSSYYVCCNKELKEEFCNEGYYFNSQTEKCEEDINHTCWPRCKEGEISANANTCSSYYVCFNNELKEEFCHEGYYFNSLTEKCEEDVNHICWQRCNEGEISANNNTCSSYYVCCNEELKEELCNEGYYFNSQTEKCEEDINHTCWPRCKEGEISANANTCSSYYVCCNNELKEEFCNVGYYFNSQTNKCEEDVNHICWQRCNEVEISANNNTCSSYYVCCNNELKEEFCNEGYYFNSQTKKCEEDVNYTCWPRCKEGEISANTDNCSSYYVCCNNELKDESCSEGYFFNSKTSQCQEDVNYTCWPRCKEGEISANTDNCSSYYVCCNNELKNESCYEGYYFNSQTNQCEEDVNYTCWPRCKEGEIAANTDNCSSYYVCCNNELREEFCNEGYYFNSKTNQCEEDVDYTCLPRCKEGEISANTDNCSSYYVCSNNELKNESCNEGYYFNSQTNQCEEDVNYTCWPRCKEGEIAANTDNCSSYYVCCNNELKDESCSEGYFFNSKTNQCEEDVNYTCWPRCKEGEISANTDNCSSYYVCCNSEWKEESCYEGYYFNSQTNQCEEDVNYTCWPRCKEGEISANTDNCSSYYVCCNNELKDVSCSEGYFFNSKTNQCEEDVDYTCWPRCKEGEVSANTDSCSSYYVCCNNELKEKFCGEDYYFNSQSNKCEEDIRNICGAQPTTCIASEQIQSPANCSAYLVCCSGVFKEQFCDEGSYFSNVSRKCEPDTDNICWVKEPCTCTGGYNEGATLPSEDCNKFYICSGGELVLLECGLNNYYNASEGICEPDTEHLCWKNYCADQSDGSLVANPKQCNAFYSCNGGESTDEVCSNGDWFDPTQSSCQPDVDAVCYNPCADEDKITVLAHPSCNKFYWCNGKHTLVGTCAVGGFNEILGSCDPKKSCSANECDGKPNYYAYADPANKTNFYVCLSGVPTLKSCNAGTEFNGNVCAHVSDPDCDAAVCQTSANYVSYPTLNATDDTAFCMCLNGYATKYDCPSDYVFSPEYGRCSSNAACNPMVCKSSPDYHVFVNFKDTNSFCMCVGNEATVVKCPSGSFNSYTSSCTEVEISEQCDQLVCRGQSNFYTYPGIDISFNGFCKCQNQIGVFVDCPENTVYYPTMGICKLNSINCDSSKCKGIADNTKLPALTTTQGYCECVAGTATYYNCDKSGEFDETTQECLEPVCDATKCIGAAENTVLPAIGTKAGFCLCANNGVEYRNCPTGGEFNAALGICKLPLNNCDDSMCVGQTDNTKLPAWTTINGYCSCLGGRATYKDCLNGWTFDKDTQSCGSENIPVEDLCDMTYCDDPNNTGQKYPSTTNNYGYCMCSSTGPAFENCNEGDVFDATSLTCSPSAANQCDLSLCASATPDNTYSTPAKNNDTLFCFCSGPNNVMLLQCPSGKYYNDDQQLCVNVIEEGCSCPNGLQNGDRAPDTTDCTQFYICNAGSMMQQSCPSGQYFNTDSNCCRDDDGTCAPEEAWTCLGAYREGERLAHPHNEQMFYVCDNKMLHERNCGKGRIFNKIINQCQKAPRITGHFRHKRSVDVDEFQYICSNDEKRSVPSNCSQYEVCINQEWKRRACTHFRYYNPEQQKCLEPRDDTICDYAKVTTLPACSEETEQQLHKGRTCQQYFRCQKGKWRLKSCGKSQYYEERLTTCLPHGLGDAFQCNPLVDTTEPQTYATSHRQCQHMSVRPYDQNCAMYLMCLESQWWYQYCPLGMYFNRSLNYCIPDYNNECPEADKTASIVNVEDFVQDKCTIEGILRPSALACNRYYICIRSQWQQQQCANQEYYDAQHSKCSPDTDGVCAQLQMDCLPHEKRTFPLNCSAYEECSSKGKWHRLDCPREEIFDNLLQRCVPNDGLCSARGLTRVCHEHETRPVAVNCTQFYYCTKDNWALGTCLKGHTYWKERNICVPHSMADKCKPLRDRAIQMDVHVANETNVCEGQLDGTSVAHPTDCTRYYICVSQSMPYGLQCSVGSFFDSLSGYCRPNDGTCRLELTGVCANATDESLVAHPTDCQAYYSCSTLTGQQLLYCPEGQYYHNYTRQCRIDHGECKGTNSESGTKWNCSNVNHGTRLAHERYCNVYYACVKGLAIPVECPDNYQFNALLGKCIYDTDKQCQDGQLVDGNQTYSCGNLTDGSYIADRKDCTRYYICSAGKAQPKKCSSSAYFDSEQLLCVPDDGSCPYVDDDEANQHPVPPDPIVCEGKHGFLMPDPMNCNNFYVCINNKLRHERCYPQHFFNTTSNQCQQKLAGNDDNVTETADTFKQLKAQRQQCLDESISVEQLCDEYADGATVADQGDCRVYITCQEEDNPISQRCRNGESYDSLLGFCRQNDGTCLLENGKRAGECSDRHGQMARDTNHCRKYFICINGQKIAQACQEHEYFSKSQNMCINDTLNTCNPDQQPEDTSKQQVIQSCAGLSESVLYPYIHDNCRSYFQCVKGNAKLHQCADDLYFDPSAIKCVKNRTDCVMPQKTMQRTPVFKKQTYDQLCMDRELDQAYANIENNCRSYYTCLGKGEVIHELCPLGMAFDKMNSSCVAENKFICI